MFAIDTDTEIGVQKTIGDMRIIETDILTNRGRRDGVRVRCEVCGYERVVRKADLKAHKACNHVTACKFRPRFQVGDVVDDFTVTETNIRIPNKRALYMRVVCNICGEEKLAVITEIYNKAYTLSHQNCSCNKLKAGDIIGDMQIVQRFGDRKCRVKCLVCGKERDITIRHLYHQNGIYHKNVCNKSEKIKDAIDIQQGMIIDDTKITGRVRSKSGKDLVYECVCTVCGAIRYKERTALKNHRGTKHSVYCNKKVIVNEDKCRDIEDINIGDIYDDMKIIETNHRQGASRACLVECTVCHKYYYKTVAALRKHKGTLNSNCSLKQRCKPIIINNVYGSLRLDSYYRDNIYKATCITCGKQHIVPIEKLQHNIDTEHSFICK